MKNRTIILTAILSLLVCGGLSSTALAAGSAPVTVINTPDVNVVNTATHPVPVIGTVAVADNPARQAVQTSTGFNAGSGFPVTVVGILTIPPGKIFVLEFVSFSASVPGGTVQSLAIAVTGNRAQGGGQVSAS